MLYHLFMLVFGIVESFLIYRIANYLLTFRFTPKYRHMPIIGISTIFTIWYPVSLYLDSTLLIVSKLVSFLLIFIVLCVFYDDTLRRKLLSLLLYLLFSFLAEGILLLLVLMPPFRMSLASITEIPFLDLMFNLFSRLLILFLIESFGTRFRRFKKESTITGYEKQLRILLLINAATFYIVLYFFSTKEIYGEIDYLVLMVSTVSILVVSLLSTFIIIVMGRRAQKDLEYKLTLHQMEMENKLNEDMGSVVTKLRSMRHDMNNHFNVMTGLINQEEYTLLKDYLSNLKEEASDADQFILLDNKALTVLLNNKLAKADMHKIQFNTKITTDSLPFTDLDLCTLLGNMIDNAIEACLQVEGSRYINLSISKKGSLVNVVCENPYSQEPTVLNNRFLTSKQDSSIHGIGIQSMRTVAKKYNAELDFRFGDGVFIAQLMM